MKRLTARLLWVPVLLVALVFSGACAPPEGGEVEEVEEVGTQEEVPPVVTVVPRVNETWTATIAVIEGDPPTIEVDPDPLTVRRGDTINWTAGGELEIQDWEVYLGPDAPTRDLLVAGLAGQTAGTRVRLTAVPDTYKYWVAVRLLLDDQFSLVRVDPEIIVENGGN